MAYILIFIAVYMLYRLYRNVDGFQDIQPFNKTIWLLWLQGWDKAPWLVQQVRESWENYNPDWTIQLVDENNLKDFVTDIDYVYRESISPQAKSDIIRLALLRKHGGVWADATLLCMQPLDKWVPDAIRPAGFWMYHGKGGGTMSRRDGPACWFIVSIKDSYIIKKWKTACDMYWIERKSADKYYWIDNLFKDLYETDHTFKVKWNAVPYVYCEDKGQPHMFADDSWKDDTPEVKKLIDTTPPYVLKFRLVRWKQECDNLDSPTCKASNGYHAIQSTKRKYTPHQG
jgi:hypothetical protein